jgi:hypothetical protein
MVLSALVFTWGLQYKLSLYAGPHSVIRHMVKAKLLSQDQQIEALGGVVLSSPPDSGHAPTAALVLASIFVPLLAMSLNKAHSEVCYLARVFTSSHRLPFQASFNSFFRPPPIFN